MKTMWALIFAVCVVLAIAHYGCDTPYSGPLGPEDFNGWIESEENGFICLWNGFDRLCIQTIEGPAGKDGRDGRDGKDGKDGKDGRDGKDGQTLIAVREVPVEVIVETIIETVVVEEIVTEVPVETVVERVVTEYVDREVPIEVFVERTVEIIKEVIREVEVPVEVVREVEVPVTVIKEVPVETVVEVIKTVYVTETAPTAVTAGAIYTEAGYHNPPHGFHAHQFTHTHDGATHTHRIIHPDGEKDDWDREHDGFSGLTHD